MLARHNKRIQACEGQLDITLTQCYDGIVQIKICSHLRTSLKTDS